MAQYRTTQSTTMSAERVWAYLSDFRNAAEWDPGVASSEIIEGAAPGAGTVYRVKASGATLDYVTVEFDAPRRTALEGDSRWFYSYDVITVEATAEGAEVTYEATLRAKSIAAVANPLLGLFFNRIGDRAAEGLHDALKRGASAG